MMANKKQKIDSVDRYVKEPIKQLKQPICLFYGDRYRKKDFDWMFNID